MIQNVPLLIRDRFGGGNQGGYLFHIPFAVRFAQDGRDWDPPSALPNAQLAVRIDKLKLDRRFLRRLNRYVVALA